MAALFPADVEAIGASAPFGCLHLASPHIELFANGLASIEDDGTALGNHDGRVARIVSPLGVGLLSRLGALAPVLTASIARPA